MPQQQGSYKCLLIDGDSISYIVGWNHRDDMDNFAVEIAVDDILNNLFRNLNAGAYLGVIGPESSAGNFRRKIYKVAAYKGNRTETPEWVVKWKPIIENRLITKWQFVRAPEHLETDDVVVAMAVQFKARGIHAKGFEMDVVICSPDKDLKQTPGEHYDYRTGVSVTLSATEALRNLYKQILTGDTTDNIKGIPKFGPVKAEKLLDPNDPFMWEIQVKAAYDDYYGSYYGPVIFTENQSVVMMMEFSHPEWDRFGFRTADYTKKVVVLA
jgi:hypothetical protein